MAGIYGAAEGNRQAQIAGGVHGFDEALANFGNLIKRSDAGNDSASQAEPQIQTGQAFVPSSGFQAQTPGQVQAPQIGTAFDAAESAMPETASMSSIPVQDIPDSNVYQLSDMPPAEAVDQSAAQYATVGPAVYDESDLPPAELYEGPASGAYDAEQPTSDGGSSAIPPNEPPAVPPESGDYSESRNPKRGSKEDRWILDAFFRRASENKRNSSTGFEAFERTPEPLNSQKYNTFDNAFDEQGTPRRSGVGVETKDTSRQDRIIDQTVEDLIVGFFHIKGEKIEYDVPKNRVSGWNDVFDSQTTRLRWPSQVEDSIIDLSRLFGLDPLDIDSQRTVFRLVRLYASMSIDRKGNMFNEGSSRWYMDPEEFAMICGMIRLSVEKWGHPMAGPARIGKKDATLRKTSIYPSGVMPAVVASAITNADSMIKMSPSQLVAACQAEWSNYTYPDMKSKLEDDSVTQRVVIEDMQRAIARIDGISDDRFSQRYGVDTTPHYKLEEYRDSEKLYAQAMNGNFDADACMRRREEIAREYEQQAAKRRGQRRIDTGMRDEDGNPIFRDMGEVDTVSSIEAGLNILTTLMKSNALLLNVPIAGSAIAEKGVGNIQTWATLKLLGISTRHGDDVSPALHQAIRTKEAQEALDAAQLLLEIGGPGALQLFVDEGGVLSQNAAIDFIRDRYLRKAANKDAQKLMDIQMKLDKLIQKMLTGDIVFKKSDAENWLAATIVNNYSLADVQSKLAKRGVVDTEGGVALTCDEIEDVMAANYNDPARFITEMVGTVAGKDAIMMMRANNIANFNPLSFKVGQFLRDHGVTNFALTAFVDTFVTYGINYVYMMAPFSRTITYTAMKIAEHSGSKTASNLVIGGGVGTSQEAFLAGLRANLIFDGMTIGRNLITGALLGMAMVLMGMEPPDDPMNIKNRSMWRIGKNLDLGGEGRGVEIQDAFWLNDLTQWGLPFAYMFAVWNETGDKDAAKECMMDCLADQFDGNVVLDFADAVNNIREDIFDWKQISEDTTGAYQVPRDFYSFAALEMKALVLNAFAKMTPGAPLVRSAQNSALLMGEDARAKDPYKVYDLSSDWAIEVGKTDTVYDYEERLARKYSMNNWLLGLANNAIRNHGDPTKTGYLWFQMPNKVRSDPNAIVWAKVFEMDYGDRGGRTVQQFEADYAQLLYDTIQQFDSPQEAAMQGFFIPHDIRVAALKLAYAEINAIENDYNTRLQSGELDDYKVGTEARLRKNERVSALYDYINDWLKNDDIPEWIDGYEVLLSDYDVSWVDSRTGEPMNGWDALFNRYAEPDFILKGNHPTNYLPFTVVDTRSTPDARRGFDGETIPHWFVEGSDGTDNESIRNGIGQETIDVGINEGKTLNDVLYGEEYENGRLHPDVATTGSRALVYKE